MPDDLIAKRHRQTRTDIAHAAIDVFLRQGFAESTMADVADAAGVSRRTAYRHFPNKEDLVFEYPRLWFERFRLTLDDRADGESVPDLFARALRSVGALVQETSEEGLRAYSVYQAAPSLLGRHGRIDADWRECIVELIGPALADDANALLVTATLAGALVGGVNGLFAAWAMDQPKADIVAMAEVFLDHIDALWPDALHG